MYVSICVIVDRAQGFSTELCLQSCLFVYFEKGKFFLTSLNLSLLINKVGIIVSMSRERGR